MADLTITHTHAEGTLIEGTEKGDGTNLALKTCGWRWGRSISAWYVPNSRDRMADMIRIKRTKTALEDSGHLVTVEIDNTPRSTADVEAERNERLQDRAEALADKATRKEAAANAAWDKHRSDVDRLPEGGEPVKVDHHSGRRHQNAIDRAHRSAGKARDAYRDAEHVQERAEAAAKNLAHKDNPVTVANRIERLSADYRKLDRQITAKRWDSERGFVDPTPEQIEKARTAYAPRMTQLQDQITYWEGVRAQQIADGVATNYSKDTVKKGDLVKIRGYWHRVARANAKTVSVETEYSWTDKSPWHEVSDHKPAEQATNEAGE